MPLKGLEKRTGLGQYLWQREVLNQEKVMLKGAKVLCMKVSATVLKTTVLFLNFKKKKKFTLEPDWWVDGKEMGESGTDEKIGIETLCA